MASYEEERTCILFSASMVIAFSRNIACSVAGITSDANVLTNYLRQAAQRLVRVMPGW